MSDPYEIVADLGSTAETLLEVLHRDVRVVEHPNAINPRGTVRDRDAVVAGFLMGKRLLAAQSFDIDEGTDVLPAGTGWAHPRSRDVRLLRPDELKKSWLAAPHVIRNRRAAPSVCVRRR